MPYKSDQSCRWIITAPTTDHTMRVIFRDFSTEAEFDLLEAGNGDQPKEEDSLVVRASGDGIPANFDSKGHQVWITFISDSRNSLSGFSIEIMDNELAGKGPITVLVSCCWGNWKYYLSSLWSCLGDLRSSVTQITMSVYSRPFLYCYPFLAVYLSRDFIFHSVMFHRKYELVYTPAHSCCVIFSMVLLYPGMSSIWTSQLC